MIQMKRKTIVELSDNFKTEYNLNMDEPVIIAGITRYSDATYYKIFNKSGLSILSSDLTLGCFNLLTANPPILRDYEIPSKTNAKEVIDMFKIGSKLTVRKDISSKKMYSTYGISSAMRNLGGEKVTVSNIIYNKSGSEGFGIIIEEDDKKYIWELTLFDEYNKLKSVSNKTLNIFVLPNGKTQVRVSDTNSVIEVIDTKITPDELVAYIKGGVDGKEAAN